MIVVLALIVTSCARPSNDGIINKCTVKNGKVYQDRYPSLEGVLFAALETIDDFEDSFYNDSYDKFLIVKAKKLTAISYYHDYGEKTISLDDTTERVPDKVAYTLTELAITEVISDGGSNSYKVGDRITARERYTYMEKEDGSKEFQPFIYYGVPYMDFDEEYLLFLQTNDDGLVVKFTITTETLDNVWDIYALCPLDNEVIKAVEEDRIKDLKRSLGYTYSYLYKDIFEKYVF